MSPSLARIRIELPPEAIVPVAIGVVVLLVLIFAGAALKDWKQRNPARARLTGTILAAALTGYALYAAIKLLPNKYIDLGPPDHPPISLADGPILGFMALIATVFWGFADRRRVALVFGGLVGLALVLKPFVMPLLLHFSEGSERAAAVSDPDTLSILGPGVAVLVTALIVGLRKPS